MNTRQCVKVVSFVCIPILVIIHIGLFTRYNLNNKPIDINYHEVLNDDIELVTSLRKGDYDFKNNGLVEDGKKGRKKTTLNDGNRTHTVTKPNKDGMAACLLLVDDTIRLTEWLAYHYTTLPLKRLVIALDRKNTPQSISKIKSIASTWIAMGVDIIIWQNDTWIPEAERHWIQNAQTPEQKRKGHNRRQEEFAIACMRDHHHHNMTWTVLTDADEYLIYNYVHDDEDHAGYDNYLHWKKPHRLENERKDGLTLRRTLPPRNTTIHSYLTHQLPLTHPKLRCLRIPGLFMSIDEPPLVPPPPTTIRSSPRYQNTLMTLRYRHHPATRSGAFSKILIDVSRITPSVMTHAHANTIHNINRKVCGHNGPYASGTDYVAALFRFHHYLGSKEAFLERENDYRGTEVRLRERIEKNEKNRPFESDDDIRGWVDEFVGLVGEGEAERLVLEPMEREIGRIRGRDGEYFEEVGGNKTTTKREDATIVTDATVNAEG